MESERTTYILTSELVACGQEAQVSGGDAEVSGGDAEVVVVADPLPAADEVSSDFLDRDLSKLLHTRWAELEEYFTEKSKRMLRCSGLVIQQWVEQ